MTTYTATRPGSLHDFARHPAGALMSIEDAASLIRMGRFLSIAADETLLRKLPAGNWVGGSIAYFIGQDGGETTRDKVFVAPLPVFDKRPSIRFYDAADLHKVCLDAPDNGYSMIIIPAFTELHSQFARDAVGYGDMFVKPLVGWISGIHLDDMGKKAPLVVNGQTLTFDKQRAIVVHCELPADRYAHIDIVNLFRQGEGDTIRFPKKGFSAGECLVNGTAANFADYVSSQGVDTRLPLVADYSGALVNVSIKAVNADTKSVDFYAPVFDDVEYRFAAPVPNYVDAFVDAVPDTHRPLGFACNCVLNYLYSELEGKKTRFITGPMTFGEVAYQLLNQTLVFMTIEGTEA
jgi:hypothetical protein